jgi:hypothetical protein
MQIPFNEDSTVPCKLKYYKEVDCTDLTYKEIVPDYKSWLGLSMTGRGWVLVTVLVILLSQAAMVFSGLESSNGPETSYQLFLLLRKGREEGLRSQWIHRKEAR